MSNPPAPFAREDELPYPEAVAARGRH